MPPTTSTAHPAHPAGAQGRAPKGGGTFGGALAWPIEPEVDLDWFGFHTLRRTRLTKIRTRLTKIMRTDAAGAVLLTLHHSPAMTETYRDRSAKDVIHFEDVEADDGPDEDAFDRD